MKKFSKSLGNRPVRWFLAAAMVWGIGSFNVFFFTQVEAAPISSGMYVVIPNQSRVSIFVRSTLHDFDTVAERFDGQINIPPSNDSRLIRIRLNFPTASLVTGNSLRDSVLRDKTLEVEKYPRATFVSQAVEPLGESKDGVKYKITGTFSIHGQTHKITVPVLVKREEDTLSAKATFPLLLSDYKLSPPSLLFMRTEDRVDVTVRFLLKKEKISAHAEPR